MLGALLEFGSSRKIMVIARDIGPKRTSFLTHTPQPTGLRGRGSAWAAAGRAGQAPLECKCSVHHLVRGLE